jgi:hypothetical protein
MLPDNIATPEEEELARKKAQLTQLEEELAERELDLASLFADLLHFEKHYLQTVGRRYAMLDDLRAKIAEACAQQNPNGQEAREQAARARAKAEGSARAAGDQGAGSAPVDVGSSTKPTKSETLRKLYRQAAWAFHPDRTLDLTNKNDAISLWPKSTTPTRGATRNAFA